MNEKPMAFLAAILVALPLCSVCILGPAVVGGLLASWFGWIGDLGAMQITGLSVLGAIVVFGIMRFVRSRQLPASPMDVERQ